MKRRSTRNLQLAALLAATASAQTVTSTIPVCPAGSPTTITLPTTATFCPGPHCNGGGSGPQITAAPVNGVGMPGILMSEYTSVGPDGMTTVLSIWETVYSTLCDTGLVPATWTITQECPCELTPEPTVVPSGFETAVVTCSVCGPGSTATLTQPCPTGPYASQTPSVGQPPAGPAAGASASASAVTSASTGSGASATSGSGDGAQAGPGGASVSADANGGSAGAGANAEIGAQRPTAPAVPGGAKVAPINGTLPTVNGTKPEAPIQSFVSSAAHTSIAGFTIFAGVVAAFLL